MASSGGFGLKLRKGGTQRNHFVYAKFSKLSMEVADTSNAGGKASRKTVTVPAKTVSEKALGELTVDESLKCKLIKPEAATYILDLMWLHITQSEAAY